jgi:hypothetical protein
VGQAHLPNRRDHVEVRPTPHRFEPELVVALARTAVREGVTVFLQRNVQNRLCDHGAGQRRPQGVPLIGGVCPHRVETQLGELVDRVDHVVL